MVKQKGSLPLNPGDYAGTYKLIGGRSCLDFVNTVSFPHTERRHDWLDAADNLVAWARAAAVIDAEAARSLQVLAASERIDNDPALRRVRQRRALLTRIFVAIATGGRPGPADIEALNRRLTAASKHRRVDPRRLRWTWTAPRQLEDIVHPVMRDAAALLTEGDHARIGSCPGCHWLFYDETRNRSRRWCDMADCGSRDKALRYYRRTKAAGSKAAGSKDRTRRR